MAFFGVLAVEVGLHVFEHVAVRRFVLRVGDVLVEILREIFVARAFRDQIVESSTDTSARSRKPVDKPQ
ncbi:MAG TPA: hypothetical protein VGU66_08945 [Candidatus Elarobacter sp.]|nr:hypothetical protein [Candidatus Elarobacter sp.]